MNYKREILPLDNSGTFLYATHFQEHSVGGEETRESCSAQFLVGHIDNLNELRDIGLSCTLPRPASAEAAKRQLKSARGQREHAPLQKSKAFSKHLIRNAESFERAARFAMQDALHVPRTVQTSRNGLIVLGFEIKPEIEDLSKPYTGLLRGIEANTGKILWEATRKSPHSKVLSNYLSVSTDGQAFVTCIQNKYNNTLNHECRLSERAETISILRDDTDFPAASVYPLNGRWVVLSNSETKISIFSRNSEVLEAQFKLPKGCFAWGGCVAIDKPMLALPGPSGLIAIVNLENGDTRRYFPHRGAARNDFAKVALSDCGSYLVSRIYGKPKLVLTRLADGASWYLVDLNDNRYDGQIDSGDAFSNHITAGFAFIGNRLLVGDGVKPREIALDEPLDVATMFVSEQGKPGARVPIKFPVKASFDQYLKAASLEPMATQLAVYYSPAVRIKTKKSKRSGWRMPGKKGAPELGASRFGGWPDLPSDVKWPRWNDRPMAFLAQINLEEAVKSQPSLRLPHTGLLLFFLGCTEETYGNDAIGKECYISDVMVGIEPDALAGWKVIYVSVDRPLQRLVCSESPLPDCYKPCDLKFVKGGNPFPDENTIAYQNLPFNDEQRENYNELLELIAPEDEEWVDQLMGYPNLIQETSPEVMCELGSRGMDPYKCPEPTAPEYGDIMSKSAEWGLLLQLTSHSDAEYFWGDVGNVYFYGKRAEMEKGDFSGVWVNFEN
jgi:uncharacterized protein YwqG